MSNADILNPPGSASDFDDVVLTDADANDPLLFVPPSKRVFGRGPDAEFGKLRFRIGRRPIATNLWQIYRRSNRALPSDNDIDVFNGYELWILLQSIGMGNDGSADRVDAFSIALSFLGKDPIAITSVYPQTQFISTLGANLGLTCAADVELGGSARIPDLSMLLGEDIPLGASAGGKAKLTLGTHADVVARLSFNVYTPTVVATGTYDSECRWRFQRDRLPLVGDQVVALVVRTPRGMKSLSYTIQFIAEVSTRSANWKWWRETAVVKSKSRSIQCQLT